MKQVGLLWKKQGKKGDYLTGFLDLGVLGQISIAIFQNEKIEGEEKKPDAKIVLFSE